MVMLALAMPAMADSIGCSDFTPDRGARNHREMMSDDDSGSNFDAPIVSNNTFSRPSRFSVSDYTVIPQNDLNSDPDQQNPPAPDAPIDSVPEPGMIMLVAPGILGLWGKFRR